MMDEDQAQALRAIADMISEYRRDYIDGLAQSVVDECQEVAKDGFDPARGKGRGAWWAEGD